MLHEMATRKCNFACFTKNSQSLLEYSKRKVTNLKVYLLGRCTATGTLEKSCLACDKGLILCSSTYT